MRASAAAHAAAWSARVGEPGWGCAVPRRGVPPPARPPVGRGLSISPSWPASPGACSLLPVRKASRIVSRLCEAACCARWRSLLCCRWRSPARRPAAACGDRGEAWRARLVGPGASEG